MDPDANLIEQLQLAAEIQALIDSDDSDPVEDSFEIAAKSDRLADLVIALDAWIRAAFCLESRV